MGERDRDGAPGPDEQDEAQRSQPGSRNWAGLLLVLLAGAGVAMLALRANSGGRTEFEPTLPWLTDAKAALAEAKAQGLPVLMVFGQPGCAYCAVLKEDVLDEPEFEDLVRDRAVLADLDITADRENLKRFRQYGARGTPALVLADPAGRALAYKEGGRNVLPWLADAFRTWDAAVVGDGNGGQPPASDESSANQPAGGPTRNSPL